MSTEIFRKYIDLLNEDVSQNDIDNVLVPALNELERVLNNPRYAGKIRSALGEAELEDPPLFAPGSAPPSPSGPKPRITRLPGESADEYLKRVRALASAARPAAETPATPSRFNPEDPMARYRQTSSPVEPEPSMLSKASAKVGELGKNLVSKLPAPGWKAKTLAAAMMTAGAAYQAFQAVSRLSFSDLDTLDRDTIEKNLKVIEPFVTPQVLPTLPDDIQARVKTVLSLLANLGKGVPAAVGKPGGLASRQRLAKTLPGPGGAGELDKPVEPQEPVKTGLDALSPAWNNQGTATPDDVNKFLDAIKNAEKYVSGIRESSKQSPSSDMSRLSEAEKMAMLRDRLNEDAGILSMLWDALGLAGSVGVGAGGLSWARSALKELWAKFLADHPDMVGKNFSEQLPKFREWVKITADAAAKSKVRGLQAGLTAGAVTLLVWLAQSGLSAYGLYKAGSMANDLVQNMGQDTKATQDVYDMYLQMPADAYNAMEQKDKDRLQKILLAHCVKFPKDPHCSTIISQICSVHPDWAGCKL
jgi:hypothetical protein